MDNVIQVAITASIGEVTAGLDAVAAKVEASTAVMAEGFATLAAASAESTAAIVEAVAGVEVAVEHEEETVRAKLAEMGAEFVEFAEKAKITSLATVSAFGIIGQLAGPLIVVGLFAEMEEHLQKSSEAMHIFSEATGVDVTTLTKWKDVATLAGVSADSVEKPLTRLTVAMAKTDEGNTKLAAAFGQLGVSTGFIRENINDADAVLEQMALHLANSEDKTKDFAATQQLFGKGSAQFNTVLALSNDLLATYGPLIEQHKEAQEAAIGPAGELNRIEAAFGLELRTIGLETLPIAVQGMKGLALTIYEVKGAILSIMDAFKAFDDLTTASAAATSAAFEAASGNFGKAEAFMDLAINKSKIAFKDFKTNTVADLTAIKAAMDAVMYGPELPERKKGGASVDNSQANTGQQEAEIEGEKAHALAMLEIEKAFLEDNDKLIGGYNALKADRLLIIADEELSITRDALEKKKALIDAGDPDAPAKFQAIQNQLIAAQDSNSKARLSIVAADSEARKKYEEEVAATTEKFQHDITEGFAKETARRDELELKSQLASIKLQDTGIQAAQKHQDDLLEMERKRIDLAAQMGEITEARKITMTQATYDRQFAMEQASIQKEIALQDGLVKSIKAKLDELTALQNSGGGGEATQAELAKMVQAYETAVQKIEQLQIQLNQSIDKSDMQRFNSQNALLLRQTQGFRTFVDTVGGDFTSGINSWIHGTQSFGAAWAKMGQNMVASTLGTLLQVGVKWAEQQAFMLLTHEAMNVGLVASDTATAAQSKAISSTLNLSKIAGAAATAAGNTYSAVSAIPIVGPILAPPAAAGAYAAVLAFGAISAEGGADLPNFNTLGFLHPREMVLPREHADTIRSMAGGNNGTGGGDFNFNGSMNFHGTNLTMDDVVKGLKKAHRNGAFAR